YIAARERYGEPQHVNNYDILVLSRLGQRAMDGSCKMVGVSRLSQKVTLSGDSNEKTRLALSL
ncbi:14417_t:CDS:1, partial [Racocetra persica]